MSENLTFQAICDEAIELLHTYGTWTQEQAERYKWLCEQETMLMNKKNRGG